MPRDNDSQGLRRRNLLKYAGGASLAGISGLSGCSAFGGGDNNGEFPSDTIRIVVGYPEGSLTDSVARVLAPVIGENAGVDVVVENMDGAAQMRAAGEMYHQREPDGHHWFASYTPSLVTAALLEDVDFDVTDFRAFGRAMEYSFALVANSQYSGENVEDLINQYSEGGLSRTSGLNVGHPSYIASVLLRDEFGMEWETYVPYDGGNEQCRAIASDEVPAGIVADMSAIPFHEDGEVDIICSLADGGNDLTNSRDIPSWTDFGYDPIDYLGISNMDWFLPPDTPDDIVDQTETMLQNAVESDEATEFFDNNPYPQTWAGADEVQSNLEEIRETLPEIVNFDEM